MLAFVDESGDPKLDVAAGATSHFAVCAICVPDEELATFRLAAEAIRKRYFQRGEINSSTVGTKNRLMTIRHWPPGPRLEQSASERSTESIGPFVVKGALQWLREHDDEGLDDDKRRIVMLALLDAAEEKSPYLTLKALHARVCALGHDVTDDFVRRVLISSLRDQGVVIASSNQGYCLPRDVGQVDAYFDRMRDEITPVLRRVRLLDEALKRATLNELRVLDSPRYDDLRRLVETSETTAREAE